LEVLHDDIGITAIERTLKRSLNKLTAGLHYGCHVTRPEDGISFDDTEEPKTMDKLVRLLGIKSIEYPDKYLCCGGGLKIASQEDAAGFARNKFMQIIDSDANCIVVTCPYCRAQLESAKAEIQESYNEKIPLPIFYYTELLGLAMGFSPEDLGLNIADTDTDLKMKLIDSVFAKPPSTEIFDEEVTKEQLKICMECQACADDCSSAMIMNYHPEELLELALEGKFDELINRKDIWYCMNCHECIDKCPQEFGMVKFIFRLKNLAIEHGICPDVIINRDTELSDSGFAFKPNSKLRKKLGLPTINGATQSDIEKLITGTRINKATKECEDGS
jgi:heterodisulfide reductase subunit C